VEFISETVRDGHGYVRTPRTFDVHQIHRVTEREREKEKRGEREREREREKERERERKGERER
jgi:hypothetical protein